MNWKQSFVLVLFLAIVFVLFHANTNTISAAKPITNKSEPKLQMNKATLEEVQDVLNNFPSLLNVNDFMKFHYTSLEENDVGFLSTVITERATKSYKDHVKKVVFFPDISNEDEVLARDQMNELRSYIDEAVHAKLDIDRKMIWSRRTISGPVMKWSETENQAKDSAQALFQSIHLLEDK